MKNNIIEFKGYNKTTVCWYNDIISRINEIDILSYTKENISVKCKGVVLDKTGDLQILFQKDNEIVQRMAHPSWFAELISLDSNNC
jgi:hypothetical protein